MVQRQSTFAHSDLCRKYKVWQRDPTVANFNVLEFEQSAPLRIKTLKESSRTMLSESLVHDDLRKLNDADQVPLPKTAGFTCETIEPLKTHVLEP